MSFKCMKTIPLLGRLQAAQRATGAKYFILTDEHEVAVFNDFREDTYTYLASNRSYLRVYCDGCKTPLSETLSLRGKVGRPPCAGALVTALHLDVDEEADIEDDEDRVIDFAFTKLRLGHEHRRGVHIVERFCPGDELYDMLESYFNTGDVFHDGKDVIWFKTEDLEA
ncbi:hypothetical protein EUX98_g1106 [Antrodiella citrinella]|uniref:Uncharacterized protein n=1 Tax=Antrodiella citrinella TaxID=2447956 RepID=A0A4S4N286_9APHY|nr:hypothetical protein EUX98_g1106 [Antrodiella citrinella]